MNRYIADLHIGCRNFFKGRTLQHDELLIKNWNSVVNNNDTIYILGDIGRCGNNKDNEYLCSVLSRLKGRKILIRGNHDDLRDYRIKQLFTEIYDYLEVTDNYSGVNQKLVLSHYPIFSWNGCYRKTILFYGHTHNNFDDVIYQEALEKLRSKVHEMNLDELNKVIISDFCTRANIKHDPYAFNVGAMVDRINYKPRTCKEIIGC